MPVLGQHLADRQVKAMKDSLTARIEASLRLKELFPHTRLWITRVPYIGDYVLRGADESGRYIIANFAILPMPGCHKIAILYHAQVERVFRGKGLGRELLRIRIAAARDNGYEILLCTCREDNGIEIKLLMDLGFRRTESYWLDNVRKVTLWVKGNELKS